MELRRGDIVLAEDEEGAYIAVVVQTEMLKLNCFLDNLAERIEHLLLNVSGAAAVNQARRTPT